MLPIIKSAKNVASAIKKISSGYVSTKISKKRFRAQLNQYRKIALDEDIRLFPCIDDWSQTTPVEPTYFYQDSWAFERIMECKPSEHVDIGSHHKYVALLSKVVSLTMVDIRPLSCQLDSIEFKHGSILDIPFPSDSIDSLSSLCVIEHIGLGRYGDPLDPRGSIKACIELSRVMKPGGNLYISVPVETNPKTYFNAHRSFNEAGLLSLFDEFTVKDKAYIYGSSFVRELRDGFGVGCYHLSKRHKEGKE